ncbi:hypothetical protein FRC19_004290 [Serendipita sp. 401]|nr:hypothetical protein FRC19_004290 [Serendipita sp. 401]KAG9055048.1 hypothetical protein FS842_003307 [Serendipita sp. 407]
MEAHIDTATHKDNGFEMFGTTADYYNEQFDGFMFGNADPQSIPFDNLNISNGMNQFYPATIAPSALTSSPHEYRRSDSPDATIVGPRNVVPTAPNATSYPIQTYVHALAAAAAAGESSSSPSSDFEEDDDFAPHTAGDGKPERRREDIRKQRIESEQRRRDELREGYNRLKSALPPSNQKSSKASILERATVCITDLNHKTSTLAVRCEELEAELRRVRVLNETLMLSAAEHRFAAAAAAAQAQASQQPNAHY